jgi:hypothetical protein
MAVLALPLSALALPCTPYFCRELHAPSCLAHTSKHWMVLILPTPLLLCPQMREVLEKFLDDDEDMHDMNLTAKEQDAQEREHKREEVGTRML